MLGTREAFAPEWISILDADPPIVLILIKMINIHDGCSERECITFV